MISSDLGKEVIKKELPLVPKLPGVYRMLNSKDEILYVGKAKNLPNRLKSYVSEKNHIIRTERMLSQTRKLEITTTSNESEEDLITDIQSKNPQIGGKLEGGKKFKIKSDFKPAGDQPEAIKKLVNGANKDQFNQVLLGVTGSGKTFTMAKVIEATNRPALILAPNKTLAAQLYGEMKTFFPDNAVEYFVSYYDYYTPEAYVPRSDTYIEKEASINEQIDRMRHSMGCMAALEAEKHLSHN